MAVFLIGACVAVQSVVFGVVAVCRRLRLLSCVSR